MNSFLGECVDLAGEEFILPSEDIWKKFDALFTPPNSPVDPSFSDTDDLICKVRCELKHDCMWSGTCDSEEHLNAEKSKTVEFALSQTMVVTDDIPETTNVTPTKVEPKINVHSGDHTYGNKPQVILPTYPGLLTPTDSEEDDLPDHHMKSITLNGFNNKPVQNLNTVLKSVIRQKPRNISELSHFNSTKNSNAYKFRLGENAQSVLSKSVLNSVRLRSNSVLTRTSGQFPMKKLVSVLDPKMVVKKNHHNGVEKLRRIEIKRHFDYLRATIPDIREVEKTSKIVILNEAKRYIDKMTAEETLLARERERLKKRKAFLAGRLKSLRCI